MANLIPPQMLKVQLAGMTARAVVCACIAATGASAFFALAFVPAYLDVHSTLAAQKDALTALKSASGQSADRDAVNNANRRADALARLGAVQPLTDAIDAVLAARTRGITLTGFNYAQGDSGGTMILSGASSDSVSFKTFSETLKGKTPVSKVTVPLSSLADIGGGTFSITASGAF